MRTYWKDFKIKLSENVYEPAEDSELLLETLEKMKIKNKKILEIGCGTGLVSIFLAMSNHVTCVDINPEAVKLTKENAELNKVRLECFQSDLFENVTGKFDMIIFNPPYLPTSDKIEGKETWQDDGQIEKFISQANPFLEKDGKILLLISSLTGKERVLDLFEKNGFKAKIINKKKIDWEELMIIEAT